MGVAQLREGDNAPHRPHGLPIRREFAAACPRLHNHIAVGRVDVVCRVRELYLYGWDRKSDHSRQCLAFVRHRRELTVAEAQRVVGHDAFQDRDGAGADSQVDAEGRVRDLESDATQGVRLCDVAHASKPVVPTHTGYCKHLNIALVHALPSEGHHLQTRWLVDHANVADDMDNDLRYTFPDGRKQRLPLVRHEGLLCGAELQPTGLPVRCGRRCRGEKFDGRRRQPPFLSHGRDICILGVEHQLRLGYPNVLDAQCGEHGDAVVHDNLSAVKVATVGNVRTYYDVVGGGVKLKHVVEHPYHDGRQHREFRPVLRCRGRHP
eukprot:PhM_4_TR9196/c0_g1_i1/m.16026